MDKVEQIRSDVSRLLAADKSGHSIDHVDRVHRLSMQFANNEEVDTDVVSLTAYLHDVDDYKLFGAENAENLTNAKSILERHQIGGDMARHVLLNIATMGYSKSLEGIRPLSLEGQIVSDADMCEAIGVQGLIRVFEYNASKDRPFFDKNISSVNEGISAKDYKAGVNEHAVQHFFDKLLLIPDILMTEPGRVEGQKRAVIMEQFLRELFREEDAKDWELYLEAFLSRDK